MDTISIAGLDKAEVLAALYNASRTMGMGRLRYGSGEQISVEEARQIISERGDDTTAMFGRNPSLYFDYLMGRPLKVDLSTDNVEYWLYDRDNGNGSFAKVIANLRGKGTQ